MLARATRSNLCASCLMDLTSAVLACKVPHPTGDAALARLSSPTTFPCLEGLAARYRCGWSRRGALLPVALDAAAHGVGDAVALAEVGGVDARRGCC